MFMKSTLAQIKLLLKQKEAIITFYVLLALCLANYIENVLAFQGYDLREMYHPMKLLLLSYNRVNYNANATLFLMQLYPILVVCPAGFALVKEQHAKQETLIVSRINLRKYYCSKLLAAFVVTAIVFILPFLVEMFLNCIAFPMDATGDFLHYGYYHEYYMQSVQEYFWSELYIKAPYFYTFLCTLLFGVVSGLLGAFSVAVSIVFNIKYKVLLFLPLYFLINATLYIESVYPGSATNWFNYLLVFHDETKNYGYFGTCIVLYIVFIVGAALFSHRKGLIN